MDIQPYLTDLENRMDAATEEALFQEWVDFSDGKFAGDIFTPMRPKKKQPSLQWPHVLVNDALKSHEAMLLQQLETCSFFLAEGNGAIPCIRANYGTGILSSVFGPEVFYLEDKADTLPTTLPIEGGSEGMRRLLDAGPPDLDKGFGARVFETGEYFLETLKDYPTLSRCVHIYHPDLQGPMDVCELLWGAEMFTDLITDPDFAHQVLELITDTYSRFLRKWYDLVGWPDGHAVHRVHWGLVHKGAIMLREDSAMNLSPEMFGEFIRPYDEKLLREFGGGAIHYCGRGSHYIHHIPEMDGGIYALNLSQPEYNDMDRIFDHTVEKGIPVIQLQREAAEKAIQQGRDLKGLVHCW